MELPSSQAREEELGHADQGKEEPITQCFIKQLSTSLRDDFAALRQEVSADLKQVRTDINDLGSA